MSPAGARLASGEGDVDVGDLVDGKTLADGVDRAEGGEERFQAIGGKPVDLEVKILARPSHQLIANPPTNDHGSSALVLHSMGDRRREIETGARAGATRLHSPSLAPAAVPLDHLVRESRRDGVDERE